VFKGVRDCRLLIALAIFWGCLFNVPFILGQIAEPVLEESRARIAC
jgi:hypothetical protein